MGLKYSAVISELLKSIKTVPFDLNIKDNKLTGVYEHDNTTVRINYSSKHGYELYVIRDNVIELSYITDNLNNFTNYLNDVMEGVVTVVNHEEILQLKQRVRDLEQLITRANIKQDNKPMIFGSSVNDDFIKKINNVKLNNSYKLL